MVYYMHDYDLAEAAKRLGVSIPEEYAHLHGFLERLADTIKSEAERLNLPPGAIGDTSRQAAPWLLALAARETVGDASPVRKPGAR